MPGSSISLGVTNQDFDASKEIWRFFNQHKNFVGIEEQTKSDFELSIYPNPNSGIFTVNISSNSPSDLTISVINLFGKEVYNATNKIVENYTKEIKLSQLAAGIYYLQANFRGNRKAFKLIVQ